MTLPRIRRAGVWPLLAVTLGVAVALSGCAWQQYAVTRTIRYATGLTIRFHPIVPLTVSLKPYRAIEMRPFDNLEGDHLPPDIAAYLNRRIAAALRGVTSSPSFVESATTEGVEEASVAVNGAAPTLLVDGDIDDYDPGSLPLRIVELGFNHIAVTVRFRLRDKQSGQIVTAASVTVQDDRATGTGRGAIDHLATRIGKFVSGGYGG